jgi:hypothetical protein
MSTLVTGSSRSCIFCTAVLPDFFFLNEFILRTLIRDFESYGMSTFVVCGIHTVLIS